MITKTEEKQGIATAVAEYVKEYNRQAGGNLKPSAKVVREVLKFSNSEFHITRSDIAEIVHYAQRKL